MADATSDGTASTQRRQLYTNVLRAFPGLGDLDLPSSISLWILGTMRSGRITITGRHWARWPWETVRSLQRRVQATPHQGSLLCV